VPQEEMAPDVLSPDGILFNPKLSEHRLHSAASPGTKSPARGMGRQAPIHA
jgi:hypothetical protein